MTHIVESCLLTKSPDGGLVQLHDADGDAVKCENDDGGNNNSICEMRKTDCKANE